MTVDCPSQQGRQEVAVVVERMRLVGPGLSTRGGTVGLGQPPVSPDRLSHTQVAAGAVVSPLWGQVGLVGVETAQGFLPLLAQQPAAPTQVAAGAVVTATQAATAVPAL